MKRRFVPSRRVFFARLVQLLAATGALSVEEVAQAQTSPTPDAPGSPAVTAPTPTPSSAGASTPTSPATVVAGQAGPRGKFHAGGSRGGRTLSEPELAYDLRIDLPVAVGGYALWNTLQALNKQLAARSCRWCDDHLNGLDSGARSALRWTSASHRATAMTLSDIGADVLTPAVTLGLSAALAARDDRFDRVPVDIVLAYEAISTAGIVTQVIKYSVGRMRPDARALPANQRPRTGRGDDAYVSFYSGHTSYVFSLATAAGTIASMRKYPGAGWIWLAGLSTATATAYFRVAADKHYLTDVLGAALVSSAIGIGVPYLAHRPASSALALSLQVAPAPDGGVMQLAGTW